MLPLLPPPAAWGRWRRPLPPAGERRRRRTCWCCWSCAVVTTASTPWRPWLILPTAGPGPPWPSAMTPSLLPMGWPCIRPWRHWHLSGGVDAWASLSVWAGLAPSAAISRRRINGPWVMPPEKVLAGWPGLMAPGPSPVRWWLWMPPVVPPRKAVRRWPCSWGLRNCAADPCRPPARWWWRPVRCCVR